MLRAIKPEHGQQHAQPVACAAQQHEQRSSMSSKVRLTQSDVMRLKRTCSEQRSARAEWEARQWGLNMNAPVLHRHSSRRPQTGTAHTKNRHPAQLPLTMSTNWFQEEAWSGAKSSTVACIDMSYSLAVRCTTIQTRTEMVCMKQMKRGRALGRAAAHSRAGGMHAGRRQGAAQLALKCSGGMPRLTRSACQRWKDHSRK